MTVNCLNNKAQFRYLSNQVLINIEKDGTLITPADPSYKSLYKSRWAVYKVVSLVSKRYQNRTIHRLKQTARGSLLFYDRDNPVCAEPSSKYLLSTTYCNTTKQEFTFGK